jgi:excisionase family DNA binding protein
MISKKALITDYSDELLSEKEAAQKLCLATTTLQVWRSTGRYSLPFIKIGGKVRYRREDLQRWLEARTRTDGTTV